MPIDDDALATWHLAVAQPLLRGPDGSTWIVRPGAGAADAIRAERLPGPDGRPCWCLGHGQHEDRLPWLATESRIHLLLDGHRPLVIDPGTPWAAATRAVDAPYRSVVHAPAQGLEVFLVSAQAEGHWQTRVFAVDAQRAVELPPWPDVRVQAAWCDGEALWACGQRPRRSDEDGDLVDTGQGLLLRAPLRPLGAPEVLDASASLRIPQALDEGHPDLAQRVAKVECWLASFDAGDGDRWLIGAPEAPHGPLGADFFPLGPVPQPDDHRDVLCARRDADGSLRLHMLWRERQWLAQATDLRGQPMAVLRGLDDGLLHRALLEPDQRWSEEPMHWHGLHATAEAVTDVDIVHHPDFAYAAAVAWWRAPPLGGAPALDGGLFASRDGLHWEFVHRMA